MQTRWMASLLLVPLFLISLAGHHSALGPDGDQAPEPERKASKLDQRAEGASMLSSMRNRARVSYAKYAEPAQTLSGEGAKGCDVPEAERTGNHGAVHDKIYTTTDGSPALVFECKGDGGFGILVFEWETGKSKTSWYDSMDQLKKAHMGAKPDKDAEAGDGKAGEAKEAPAADDVWALYKKKGRSWMHKSSSLIGEMDEIVSYIKYEITEVTDKYAMLKTTLMDAEKKTYEYAPPQETKIKFNSAEPVEGTDAPKVEHKEESIEIAGKKWDALVTEMEVNGMKTRTWMSKKFPGLILKVETTGESGGMKMNTKVDLVEWNE